MTDLTDQMLPVLQQYRLSGLQLGDDLIYPAYEGRSILNIPASLCSLFAIPQFGMAGPLTEEILSPLGNSLRKVILVLMDALAFHRLQRWMQDGTAPVWGRLAEQGVLSPITSITPSTTSAALTSLWTGRSAAEHGITGYEMWLKEYGVVANTILHTPITFKNDAGGLQRAGFSTDNFLPLPKLGSHLATYDVRTYGLLHHHIVNSGLSTMLFQDVKIAAFNTLADTWINLRHLLESSSQERLYAWVYWSEVDHFGHIYGPDDERTQAEFAMVSEAMEDYLLQRLSPAARKDTLLILTADHGQITTRPNPHYELRNHPDLMRRLHIYPTGENRLAFLYVRPGQSEAVREYLERNWPGQFVVLESAYAAEAGLFGTGKPHPHLLDRLGEYTVVSRHGSYLWWADKDNPLIGRHGGMHPQEMLVPFLAVRL